MFNDDRADWWCFCTLVTAPKFGRFVQFSSKHQIPTRLVALYCVRNEGRIVYLCRSKNNMAECVLFESWSRHQNLVILLSYKVFNHLIFRI